MGYSLWSRKELDTTEGLTHTHTHTLQDLSSPTKDPTQGPRSESTESQLLGSQGIASNLIFKLPIN